MTACLSKKFFSQSFLPLLCVIHRNRIITSSQRRKALICNKTHYFKKRNESEDKQLSEGQPTQPLSKTEELGQLIEDGKLPIDPYFENLTQKEFEDKSTMKRKKRRLVLDDDDNIPEGILKENSQFELKEEEGDFEILNVSDGNIPWMILNWNLKCQLMGTESQHR
ncbi:MAG: hypothetical protein EZS28_032013 [Streblomastix strix]|uniref:Uncharacterized protein n=1 Tax=Streblomastix strix TaxID=222440 RepID=A0A5J4UPW9_9EUKA|nr:MAG: hypothetical protein EZS28_032013 [Streblomastix strix]